MKKTLTMLAVMAAHFAAFSAKADSFGAAALEKREDPSIKTVSEAIDKIATAFDEYKKNNDARIEAIKAGKGTAELDAKLAKMDEAMNSLSETKSNLEKLQLKLSRPGVQHGDREQRESSEATEYRDAFLDWVRSPADGDMQQRCLTARKAVEAKQIAELKSRGLEKRAAQVVTTTGSAGGFALPEQIERAINRLSVDISPIRQIAHVITVGTTDYKELFDVNGATFEWLGEADTRNQTNTPDIQECAPTFGMASAKPQASEESLDDLFFNVEGWLIDSVSEAIAQGEGAAFIAGNGTKKPTGFLTGTPVATTDASRAYGVLQYIASGQAAAMPTSLDTLYDVVYSLRARYRRNAHWVSNKLLLASLRKYKDTTGAYLWQPSLSAGQPDLFMGYGVTEAEDMPVVAANAFPLAFGDFKEGYLIADRVGMRITRDEITTPGFVKYYARKRVGGKVRNTQAIKLLKIATT